MTGPALNIETSTLPGTGPTAPVRALVLDDSDFDRTRVARLLRKVCGSVSIRDASDISDFRSALDEADFDLILIDYLLVGETGLTAVDLLAQHPRQSGSTAIMVAGEGNLDIALRAMRRGCTDYIPKSDLSVDGLRDILANALQRTFERVALRNPTALSRTVEGASLRFAAASGGATVALGQQILSRIGPLCANPPSTIGVDEIRAFRDIEMTAEQMVEIAQNLKSLAPPRSAGNFPSPGRRLSLAERDFEGQRPN